MTLPKDTVLWSDWAAKAWGNDWTIGKATAKAKAKHAKWDYEKNEYVCNMVFVTRVEYHTQRELWFQHCFKALNNRIDTLTITDGSGKFLELEAENKDLKDEIKDLKRENKGLNKKVDELEDNLNEAQSLGLSEDVEWALSYLRAGQIQDTMILLERVTRAPVK